MTPRVPERGSFGIPMRISHLLQEYEKSAVVPERGAVGTSGSWKEGARVSPRVFGLLVAAVVFVADQASKLWILHGLGFAVGDVLPVTPFLNLVLVWNRGISYGLMQQEADLGRWALVGLTAAAAVLLSVWLWRTRGRLSAAAVGLVLGGALGNLVDRMAYGAVVDFVHLHVGDVSWYVFNIADAAIVAGVIGLLWESFRPGSGGNAAKKPH